MRFANLSPVIFGGLVSAAPPVQKPGEIQIMFTYPNGSTTDFITVPNREQWFPIGSGDPVGAITISPPDGQNVRCQFLDPANEFVATPALTHYETIRIDPRQEVALTRCTSS